jgi:two-component system, sensor histidine kinase
MKRGPQRGRRPDCRRLDMNRHPHEGPSRRLLVVDDDCDYADAVCQMLRLSCDWTVDVAYGPAQALSAVAINVPDAVMIDLEIAEVSGFETADRLLAATSQKRPVLVAVTGNANLRVAASHDVRFSDALLKPVDARRLLGLLDELAKAEPTRPQ